MLTTFHLPPRRVGMSSLVQVLCYESKPQSIPRVQPVDELYDGRFIPLDLERSIGTAAVAIHGPAQHLPLQGASTHRLP